MTIPDLGHCAGSGAAPLEGTVEQGDPATGRLRGLLGSVPSHRGRLRSRSTTRPPWKRGSRVGD